MSKLNYNNVETVVNLTPQQMGMMFLYLKDKSSNLNLVQVCLDLKGSVCDEKIDDIWGKVINRHPILRAVFRWNNVEAPLAIILKKPEINIEHKDLSELSSIKLKKKIEKIQKEDASQQFDLEKGAIRFKYIKKDDRNSLMIITMHHIICDGWSTSVLIKEALKLCNGEETFQRARDDYYKKYVSLLKNMNNEEHDRFWSDYYDSVRDKKTFLRKSYTNIKNDMEQAEFFLRCDHMTVLNEFTSSIHISAAALYFFCWGKTLEMVANSSGAVFDITTSTRNDSVPDEDINSSVGLFINTVSVCTKKNEIISDFYYRLINNLRYSQLPVRDTYKELSELRTLIVVENYPLDELMQQGEEGIILCDMSLRQNSGYDITVMIIPQRMQVIFSYNRILFSNNIISELYQLFEYNLIVAAGIKTKCCDVEKISRGFNIFINKPESKESHDSFNNKQSKLITDTEKLLSGIWSRILRIDDSDIYQESNFFELSGHSLDTIYMINEVEAVFHVRMKVSIVYELAQLSKIADYIDSLNISGQLIIEKAEKKDKYPVSAEQKRMYLLNELNRESIHYNVSTAYIISGNIDVEKLRSIFQKIIGRHEAMRTTFVEEGETVYQIIHENVQFKFECDEVEDAASYDLDEIAKGFIRHFDLKNEIPIRIKLVRLIENEYYLMIDMHHIISDGVSTGLLINDFLNLYQGEEPDAVVYQYKDYSEWQHSSDYERYITSKREFWMNEFKDRSDFKLLEHDCNDSMIPEYTGHQLYFSLDNKTISDLDELARKNSTSLFTVLLSCYYLMFFKISKRSDMVVGIPVANRTVKAFEKTFGVFVNTLPLRMTIHNGERYGDFLKRLGKKLNNALDNQDYQLDQLYEELGKIHKENVELLDVSFLLQNMHIPEVRLSDIKMNEYALRNDTTKFNLIFIGIQYKDETKFEVVYCSKFFKNETIVYYIDIYKKIIQNLINDKELTIEKMIQSSFDVSNSIFSDVLS